VHLPELTQAAGAFGSLGKRTCDRMDSFYREMTKGEENIAGIDVLRDQRGKRLLSEPNAKWALKVAELKYCDARLAITFNRCIPNGHWLWGWLQVVLNLT